MQNIEIIESFKYLIPCQQSEVGTVTINAYLCKYADRDAYFACLGSGEVTWVLENGKRLTIEEACLFFDDLTSYKPSWIN